MKALFIVITCIGSFVVGYVFGVGSIMLYCQDNHGECIRLIFQ